MFNRLQQNKTNINIDEKILQFRFGESGSEHEIIVVISTHCEFCKTQLEVINKFINSWHPKITIFIIFCINQNSQNEVIAFTKFANLYSKDKGTSISKFINYLNNARSDIDIVFHHSNDKGKNSNETIINQTKWCEKVGIYKVPTIFVDRKIIPEQYDLKDFLYMY